ncbi:hypothetical protein HAX54_035210, partial [Datura stramonium]|nr:hypothetical protein [Datura stramonium]
IDGLLRGLNDGLDASNEDISAFEEHGEIEEGSLITDKVTGRSRGYAFITYKDMESAQIVLESPSKMID